MRWTWDMVNTFYCRCRDRAKCNKCGKGRCHPGPHPDKQKGGHVRIVGADLPAMKKRIRESGWLCRGCRRTEDFVVATSSRTSLKKELADIRRFLKRYKSDFRNQFRQISDRWPKMAVIMAKSKDQDESAVPGIIKGWEDRGVETCTWYYPDEYEKLWDRERELVQLLGGN